jgi:nitrous oxidase accessory protein NosD
MDSNYGVLVGDSSNNIFYKNYFINIKENPVSDQAITPDFFSDNIWDNGFEGNYWSDYLGEDLDNDNIGDSIYFLYGENIDSYPLMNYPKITINPEDIIEETDSSFQTFKINLEVILRFLIIIIIIFFILFILRQKKK